jgi:hypothetical protein
MSRAPFGGLALEERLRRLHLATTAANQQHTSKSFHVALANGYANAIITVPYNELLTRLRERSNVIWTLRRTQCLTRPGSQTIPNEPGSTHRRGGAPTQ